MHFIFKNINTFSPVWVWFRISTVLPFKKLVEKVSYSQFDWAILKYLPVFMFSILGIRGSFFPSLLAWAHDINLLWLCHVGSAVFQTSILDKALKKKNLWRVLLFHGTHAPIALLLLSLCAAAAPILRLCSVRENKVGDILLHQTFSLRHHVTCKCTQSQHIHYLLFICLAVLSEDVAF